MNLIDAFDLEAYLQRFDPVSAQPGEVVITCPVCGKDKLVVNLDKRAWHCWVCEDYRMSLYGRRKAVAGAGGLLDLIQLLEGCSREQALGIVADQSRHLPVDIRSVDTELQIDHDVVVQEAPTIDPPVGWRPIDHATYSMLPYVQHRGITLEDVVAFGLGYCESGLYSGRLVFPVWEGGRSVYFQARAMWESADPRFRKTLNPANQSNVASASEVLMNLDVARRYRRVALVEGPVDCVHVGPEAVATFGKKISMTQILKLRRAGVRAIDLMWDGPSDREPMGAWPEMMRTAAFLSGVFDVRLVFVPRGDPGLYSRQDNAGFRARGVPASAVSRLAMV